MNETHDTHDLEHVWQLEAEIAALKTDLRDARTQTRVMLDQWHDMENQRNAAAERAGIAEAALRERALKESKS